MPLTGNAVLLVFLSVLTEADAQQQEQFTELFLFSSPLSWNNAQAHCASLGMTLAFLDPWSNQYMEEMMQYDDFKNAIGDDFWIGIYDSNRADESQDATGYSWAVSCDSLESSWTRWKSGEPQNTQDSFCMAMFKDFAKWRSAKCSEERPFLCGKQKDSCDYIQTNMNKCNNYNEMQSVAVSGLTLEECQDECETRTEPNYPQSHCWWYTHEHSSCMLSYGVQPPKCGTNPESSSSGKFRRSCVSFTLEESSLSSSGLTSDNPNLTCPPPSVPDTTERETTTTEAVTTNRETTTRETTTMELATTTRDTRTTELATTTRDTTTTELATTTGGTTTTELATTTTVQTAPPHLTSAGSAQNSVPAIPSTTTDIPENDVTTNPKTEPSNPDDETSGVTVSSSGVTFTTIDTRPASTLEQTTDTSTDSTSEQTTDTSTDSTSEQTTDTSTDSTSEQTTDRSTDSTSEQTTDTSTDSTSDQTTDTRTDSTSEQTTDTSTDSASEQSSCNQNCRCVPVGSSAVTSPPSLIVDFKEELSVDVRNLSSTRRKKESAGDPRASSAYISIVCIVLLLAAVSGVFLLDVPLIYRHLKYGLFPSQRKKVFPSPSSRP